MPIESFPIDHFKISYTKCHSSSEHRRSWEAALQLMSLTRPSSVSLAAAMEACSLGSAWQDGLNREAARPLKDTPGLTAIGPRIFRLSLFHCLVEIVGFSTKPTKS